MTVRLISPVLGLHLNDLYTGALEAQLLAAGLAQSPDLGPVTASSTAGRRSRVPVTGLAYGEKIVQVSGDGMVGAEGLSLITYASTPTTYTLSTSLGRTLSVAVTPGGTTPAPSFTTQPSISPSSAASGSTFTATPGTVANGSIISRAWLLNGTSISTGLTALPSAAGTLTYQETASGPGGTTQSSVQSVTVTAGGQPSLYTGAVANNARVMTAANSGANKFNSSTPHVMTDDVTGIQFKFANWYWSGTTSGDSNPGFSQTYQGSVEYPAGTFTPLAFGGAAVGTTATTDDDITTDVCPVTVPNGATIKLHVHMETSTGWFAVVREAAPGVTFPASVACLEYGTGITNKAMTGTTVQTNAGNAWFPVAVIGQTRKPTYLLVGDSIFRGANDNYDTTTMNHGFIEQAIANKLGTINIGSYGDTAKSFVTGSNSTKRQALKQYCSHVIVEYGCNDLASRTSAQITADLNTIMGYFSDKRVYRTTITPRSTVLQSVSSLTSSGTTVTATTAAAHNLSNGMSVIITGATPSAYNGTFAVTVVDATTFTYTAASAPASSPATGTIYFNDQWATAANQVLASAYAVGGTVDTVNANIRAGLNGSLGVFDGLSAWFDSNNKWLTDGSALKYTADGTHPSPYSASLRAAAIASAVQAVNRTVL